MYTKHVYVQMWKGKGVGKIHLADWNAVCENNPWYEYSISDMVLEESTHTVLSEAQDHKMTF